MARITKKTQARVAREQKAFLRPPASSGGKTRDSYQNFGLNLGMGTNNALAGSTYGFNPITRNRQLLEWIHRGSWLGGMVVDLVADDMVRAGIDITCDADPKDIEGVQNDLQRMGAWDGVRDTVAWSRLYGGSIGVIMIDGQDYSTPLDPDRIGKGQFRGVYAIDRWMVDPSLNDLVAEAGPYFGMPKFYRVTSDVPGLRMKQIHYTRIIRFDGVRLPYWQRVSENLWGISVIERLYDRMVAFDSATQGASQLAYKSFIRTVKIEGLRELIAAGGDALNALVASIEFMRQFQGIEGVTLLDGKDEFIPNTGGNMTGMSEIILQLGQQISGATQIPLVRLFGQSPAGLNSTGESDLRTYYDGIAQQQTRYLLMPMTVMVRAAALSGGWKIPDDYQVVFRPLWQLSEEQKSEVANRDTTTISQAEERGLISQQTAMKELKQQSKVTGRFTNITDEEIEEASEDLPPRGEEAIAQETDAMKDRAETIGNKADDESRNDPKDMTSRDSEYRKRIRFYRAKWGAQHIPVRDALPVSEVCGLPIAIETVRGSIRRGVGENGPWESVMPADYGYIRRAPSAEGPTEWLDCFVGPVRSVDCPVHVIDGYTPLGEFDEHKVMLGFESAQDALTCYHSAYNDGRRAGAVTTMSSPELQAWYQTGDVNLPLGEKNLRLHANGA